MSSLVSLTCSMNSCLRSSFCRRSRWSRRRNNMLMISRASSFVAGGVTVADGGLIMGKTEDSIPFEVVTTLSGGSVVVL